MNRVTLVLVATLAIAACTPQAAPLPATPDRAHEPDPWVSVLRHAGARDYFALRDHLEARPVDDAPARFGRALVQHATNEPGASNATIGSLLEDNVLPDSLAVRLRRVQLTNHLRLFEYVAGRAAADALLADASGLDPELAADVLNMRRIFAALADVPPQRSRVRGESRLTLEQGRVPVVIEGSARRYVFDTGANLSTLMRSEAEALGLRILPAGIDVGTATERRITADLAVATRLTIGEIDFRNVVFLVLDDELLTFPGGYRIEGIIGFPVIERMGEVQVNRTGELIVPASPPPRTERNLVLHDLKPLTRVGWEGAWLLCQVDSGADATVLYEPVLRRHRTRVEGSGEVAPFRWGGAGGLQEMPAYRLRQVELAVGDTAAVLDSTWVLTRSIARTEAENFLDCNLGQDVLGAYSRYVLNLRDMAFLLR